LLFVDNLYWIPHPFERIDPGEQSWGFHWGPTNDLKEADKRYHWDHLIPSFEIMMGQFIRSRKGKGKEYFEILAWYFMDEMYDMNMKPSDAVWETARKNRGWIRSSKIEHDLSEAIPHRTSLFRLLADMVDAEILQKKLIIEKKLRSSAKKKKASVYYRMLLHDPFTAHLQVMTHEELLPTAIAYYEGFKKYGELYLGARRYLKLDGFEDTEIDEILLGCLDYRKEYEGEELYRINLNLDLDRLLEST
jgi:hypothetical protein